MKKYTIALSALALGASVWLGSADAHANGMTINAQSLAAPVQSTLAQQIAAHKAQNPTIHEAVFNVQGVRPEVYTQFRNPTPLAGRELRHLGKEALLPMLDALAFHAPVRGSLTDAEWNAYQVGLLDAVGVLRDKRAEPVLVAVLTSRSSSDDVAVAAAEAIGRLATKHPAALKTLTDAAKVGSPLRAAAIRGIGETQSLEAVKFLVSELQSASSVADVTLAGKALGSASNAGAWKTLGAKAAADSDVARSMATQALVKAIVRAPNASRELGKAVTLARHDSALAVVAQHRATATAAAIPALDKLERKLELKKH